LTLKFATDFGMPGERSQQVIVQLRPTG